MAVKILTAIAFMLSTAVQAGDISVITNPSSEFEKINIPDLRRLYLGRATESVPNDLHPVDLPEGSPIRNSFYKKVIRRSPEQMQRYWARAFFMGTANPPRTVYDEKEMKQVVSHDPAVGYISSGKVDESVKELVVE